MPRCPSCREMIRGDLDRAGARCPYCREPLYEPPGPPTQPAGPGDSQCAAHAANQAAGTCQRCGNYLCAVCRTRWRGRVLCAACVERALEEREQPPAEARAQLRQAILALVCGLGAWGVVVVGLVFMGIGGVMAAANERAGGELVAGLGVLVALASVLLSVQGIGQGAAAIRARGGHLILATAGLLLSTLHAGLLIGLFAFLIRQSQSALP